MPVITKENYMEVTTAKTICIFSLFLSTWFFTCAPYFLVTSGVSNPKNVQIRETVISYLKCFAGGVFMSACFLNLLPSGIEAMDEYFMQVGIDTKFPAFMCIAALGFFIIAAVELLAHSLIHKAGHESHDHSHHSDDHLSQIHDISHHQHNHHQSNGLNISKQNIQIPGDSSGGNSICPNSDGHSSGHNSNDKIPESFPTRKHESLCMEELGRNQEQHKVNNYKIVSNGAKDGAEISQHKVEMDQGHDEVKDMLTVMEVNPLRAFLLLAALSFHTVFDGLAIGLETTQSDVWQMFTAIIIHKSLVAICLGLQLFLQYKDRPIRGFLWSIFFAIISPIGIGIGMALTSGEIDETARLLTNTFLQGLATGTFLFVTFFEILKEELVDKKGFKRLFLVAFGFTIMGLAKYFLH